MLKVARKEKGFSTLLFTLIILMVVTVLALISAKTVFTHQRVVLHTFQSQQTFQVAQGGLDYGIPYLSNHYDTVSDGDTVTVNLSNGNRFVLVFEFLSGKDAIKITSTGYAGGSSTPYSVEQIVRYSSGSNNITSTYPVQARGTLEMENNATIYDLSGGLYSAKLGGNASLKNNAKTILDSGVSSTRGNVLEDIVLNDLGISSQSDADLELAFLGAPISSFQNETASMTLPSKSGDYSYNNDIDGMQDVAIEINHSGGVASFKGNSSLGSEDEPVVLIVNLSNSGTFEVGNNAEIHGKIVVNNGSVKIGNNAKITGNLVIQGDLELGNNVKVTGDVIVTGKLNMNNNAKVDGAVFSLGEAELRNNAQINGALLSGEDIEMENNAKVIYNPVNAAITVPGETGQAGYSKVVGSWTDRS